MVQMQACSFHQTLEGTCNPGKDSRVLTSRNKIKKNLVAMGVGVGAKRGSLGQMAPRSTYSRHPSWGRGCP